MDPLNPLLFAELEQYYGKKQVEIVNAGVANNWETVWTLAADGVRRYPSRRMHASGEEYKVRCQRCRDQRARLQINHRWGVMDEETQSLNLWLIQCWNEQCYDNYDAQKQLYDKLFSLGPRSRKPMSYLPGRPSAPRTLQPVRRPGTIYTLEDVIRKMPGHPVLSYLEGRGFDPLKLSRLWQIGYCGMSDNHFATYRIYIPIHMNGMLVGYQMRYIGDSVDGMSFNKAGVPKYWTSKGMPKRLVLYNGERAMRHKTLILVEGPADCWNVGPMATAVLGKTLSTQQMQLIVDGMKLHGDDGVVIVALDPKPDKTAAQRNRPHHIERVVSQLFPALGNRVVPVYLPEAFDPGSIDRAWMREIVHEEASKRGLRVSFAKPTL